MANGTKAALANVAVLLALAMVYWRTSSVLFKVIASFLIFPLMNFLLVAAGRQNIIKRD